MGPIDTNGMKDTALLVDLSSSLLKERKTERKRERGGERENE